MSKLGHNFTRFWAIYFMLWFLLVWLARDAGAAFTWPTKYDVITTDFIPGTHNGLDLATDCGTPVYSSGWGTVTYAGWDTTGFGNMVMVDDGTNWTINGHLSEINVYYGQEVVEGDLIGRVGSTGWSTGCHLHLEIHWEEWGPRPYGGAVNPWVVLP